MFAEVNGVRLFYEKTGEGRPLVLIHGNGEDHTIFDEAVEVLKDRFACYAVDSRGHGQSTPCDDLHYRDMAEDIIAFLEALNLGNAALYGFSDGGIIGLIAAAKCPRITDLAVSGANVSPAGVTVFLRVRMYIDYLRRRDPKTRLMMYEPDISDEELSSIRARTLVLAGSGDLIKEKETRHIASMIPGARLQILPGEDHGSYIVHSEKIARILEKELPE